MQSRLGIASFVLGVAVGAGYIVIRILLANAPNALVALNENLGFMVGASLFGVVGVVLGILGWSRAGRSGRKPGLAIIGTALGLAVIAWSIVVWIEWFTEAVSTSTT